MRDINKLRDRYIKLFDDNDGISKEDLKKIEGGTPCKIAI
ncbi:hypothetical protein BSF41_08770 [Flavobacterium sp. ACN2]|nr:hypothetical protein BSF41_08770 [Flavobacterium sp. ACN2]